MRYTVGYSLLNYRRNEDFLEDLKVGPIKKKLAQYKQKLLTHVGRIKMFKYSEITL